MAATKTRVQEAEALVKRQIAEADKKRTAPRPGEKIKVPPYLYDAVRKMYMQNELGEGPRPADVPLESVTELLEMGLLRPRMKDGKRVKGTGARYTLTVSTDGLELDESVRKSRKGPKAATFLQRDVTPSSVLTIGAREKEILKSRIQEYLSFATGLEARKHEERVQAPDLLDRINARAKDLLATAKREGRPMTPREALAQADRLEAQDFESVLKAKFDPIFFSIFGVFDSGDTSERDMRH